MNEKISKLHQSKAAIIYIRQSSPTQVKKNTESLELQYALSNHAVMLGWRQEDIKFIDSDLGFSAATSKNRAGFHELMSLVGLGHVGIILSYEVTRFARNCRDWYGLLDLCSLTKTLIGERDGIYDPSSPNDRLLLGMKGQISELELHTIRGRLIAGAENKAKRGELITRLPAGFEFLPSGKVTRDPDASVQKQIEWVFESFIRRRSLAGVLREMHTQGMALPRRGYSGEIIWRKPCAANLSNLLKNPAYAGFYAWGNLRRAALNKGQNDYTQKEAFAERYRIFLPGVFPAYVTEEMFSKVQDILAANYAHYKRNGKIGVARNGQLYMHGIVWCGKCGNKMTVSYNNGPTYCCRNRNEVSGQSCQSIRGELIDEKICQEVLKALEPAEVDIYNSTIKDFEDTQNSADKVNLLHIEKLRYEARLCEKRYKNVDPENRLVARGLEEDWNRALQELEQVERRLAEIRRQRPNVRSLINKQLKSQIESIGLNLKNYWSNKDFSIESKKNIIRTMLTKVILDRLKPDICKIRLVWAGNAVTEMQIGVHCNGTKNKSDLDAIRSLIASHFQDGSTDLEIMQKLNDSGYRDANGALFKVRTVIKLRREQLMFLTRPQQSKRKTAMGITIRELCAMTNETDRSRLRRQLIHHGVKIQIDKENRVSFIEDSAMLQRFLAWRTTQLHMETST